MLGFRRQVRKGLGTEMPRGKGSHLCSHLRTRVWVVRKLTNVLSREKEGSRGQTNWKAQCMPGRGTVPVLN